MATTVPTPEEIARRRAQRKRQRLSVPFEMPELPRREDEADAVLTAAEREFFVANGFVVKKDLLDPALLERAMDRVWEHAIEVLPRREGSTWRLERDDPTTWVDPQWAEMPPHPDSGPFQGRQPLEYYGAVVKLHDLGTDEGLIELLPNAPAVRAVARVLLGEPLRPSTRTRGVYAVFPTTSADDPDGNRRLTGAALGPHTDQVCQQLNVVAYLDDVRPRNGGFTVYPGSHRIMFAHHELESNWSPRRGFRGALEAIARDIEPYELVAPKGSVIFWHGRTVHSAGIHTGCDIRWALIGDYTLDQPVKTEAEHRELLQYEWFKDTKLFADDHPVTDDMWRGWRIGTQADSS